MKRKFRIYLDTSVIIAALLSERGGSRKLFRLGEAGVIRLIVGPNVLRECEDVLRRKLPNSLPMLAYILALGKVKVATNAPETFIELTKSLVAHEPDSYVLADAICAEPDWFITHDIAQFLHLEPDPHLTLHIGTPGDLLKVLEDIYRNLDGEDEKDINYG